MADPVDVDATRRMLRITCADALLLLTDHLEAALPADDRERLTAHLAGCEACSAYLDQLRSTVEIVGSLAGSHRVEVDEATMEELASRFVDERS